MNTKWVNWIFVCVLGLTAHSASADLDDTLDEMFTKTSVLPTISQNARQKVISGGYVRLRSPNKRFSVASFNPPRLSAGCGGIDFYGGSFSFINKDEFRALLRQIGSQAIGYAFNIALSAICGDCMAIMNDLQKKIAEMNKHLSDTCALAKGISVKAVSSLEGKWSKLDNALQSREADEGVFEDLQDAFSSFGDEPGRSTTVSQSKCAPDDEACKSDATSAENSIAGNHVAKAFFLNAGSSVIQGVDDKTAKMLALNVLGMKSISASSQSDNPVYEVFPPRIRYSHLRSGGNLLDIENNKYQIWSCPVTESDQPNLICLHPVLEDWDYAGAEEYVYSRLLGELNGTQRLDRAPNGQMSIVAAFSHGDVSQITGEQVNFLFSMGENLYRPLMRVQGNPEHIQKVAEAIAPHLIEAVQIKVGQSFIEQMQTLIKNTPNLQLDEEQKEAYKEFVYEHSKAKQSFKNKQAHFFNEIDALVSSLKRGY